MDARKCEVCSKETYLQYHTMVLAGKRFKSLEAWCCSNECASRFFGEKVSN